MFYGCLGLYIELYKPIHCLVAGSLRNFKRYMRQYPTYRFCAGAPLFTGGSFSDPSNGERGPVHLFPELGKEVSFASRSSFCLMFPSWFVYRFPSSFVYRTLYLLKTGFAKKPKNPV